MLALKHVRDSAFYLQATLCAMFANAKFLPRDQEGYPRETPYEAEHFLGTKQRNPIREMSVADAYAMLGKVAPDSEMPPWYLELMANKQKRLEAARG